MNESGIKIEAHLIHNFAPSNLNRDDVNQPKSAMFGGVRRARISSQCSKRAARLWCRDRQTLSVGERTKRLQQLLLDALKQTPPTQDEEFLKEGIRVFTDAYYAAADKKEPEHTKVLLFISSQEVGTCAQVIRELWDKGIESIVKKRREHQAKSKNKKTAETGEGDDREAKDKHLQLKTLSEIEKRIKDAETSTDIALFGRMLAEKPGRETHASCQVAHPLSTHKVDMEMDFYTAVDDLKPEEKTGAGMMGTVSFNSACYYRYALVDRDQLARNLSRKTDRSNGKWQEELLAQDYQEADKVIKAFLEAMVYALPTGKQNSFAAQNLPSFGMFVRRKGGVPVSLANAFAKPVRPMKEDDDLIGLSVSALTKHWDKLQSCYGDQGIQSIFSFHVGQEGRLNGLSGSVRKNVNEAIEAVIKPLLQR